ncbi:DUF2007 domain-containing protein [Acinetobacter sp. A3.8]|uniref:DUF2007 domain-containing protein n=1 Tax=Acinetobacter sedimenti TaxID=2919922 RepID=A0A9X1WZH4_9GAMM|nr:DUF2007 domain-containing protein [Acinetobacter sedimenti]MCJ8146702.1 DUF2007 domain-containing protein [Acinetobacter sedimenti]
MKWVSVQSFSFPYEAQIAKSQLYAVGIDSRMDNEHTINMDWLYSNALGGVRLFVLERDFEKAKKLLEQDFSDDMDLEFGVEKLHCSHCQSNHVTPHTQGKRTAYILFMLLGFPLSEVDHGYLCQQCNHFFKARNDFD